MPPNSDEQQPPVPQSQQTPPQYAPPQYAPPQYPTPEYPTSQPNPEAPSYSQFAAPVVPGPGEPFDGAASPDDLTRPLYGASFGQAVRRFFKNYANFSGRASRSEYWWAYLFLTLASLVPAIVFSVGLALTIASAVYYGSDFGYALRYDQEAGTGIALLVIGAGILAILTLGTLIPHIALVWRRLHDSNLAGPLYFLTFTSIGSLVVLVFMFFSPDPEGRRFDRR